MMNDKYQEKCPKLQFNNVNFTYSELHEEVDGFSVSEKTLYQQNKDGKIWTLLKKDLEMD